MLTTRGWWFLTAAALAAIGGSVWLGRFAPAIPLVGLSLLAWFAFEWVLFAARVRSSADRLRVDRALVQGGRIVPAVWAGATVTVRVTVTSYGWGRLPFVVLEDRPPTEHVPDDRSHRQSVVLVSGVPECVEYAVTVATPGVLRFEGVQVRIADACGFFYHRLFIRQPAEYLVMPPLTDDEGRAHGVKRFNMLPPPGVHRLRRPGGGSELLDLREYIPGDPPKMIAWKASARKDKLITKEIESDVPVRCVLFVDASTGARIGPPGKAAVVQLAAVAAGVAQAAAANRDLVGLTVFDEATATALAPARTHIHMIQVLRTLGEAAARLPDPAHVDPDLVARYAQPFAQEIYPDLLRRDVNSRPFGMYWLPIADSRWLFVLLVVLFSPWLLALAPVRNFVARTALIFAPSGWAWVATLGLVMAPMVIAGFIWLLYGIRGFFSPRGPRTARRKQLAALFAVIDADTPAAIERYLNDDVEFCARATQFLLAHRIRLPLVLFDRDGQYRFKSEGKLEVVAAAITRAIARARDNELYVVLIDVAELDGDVRPLVNAAKVARARHHRVVVLIPWPADAPPPDEPLKRYDMKLGNLVKSVLVRRYQRNYAQAKTALARAGATVVRVDDGDPVRLVLDRLDRLRGVRTRR